MFIIFIMPAPLRLIRSSIVTSADAAPALRIAATLQDNTVETVTLFFITPP
jgi:hypothetical protein